MRARIGKRRVGGAGAGELGVQLDDVADIDHDQERRPAFLGRQRAGVAFGLARGRAAWRRRSPCGGVLPQASWLRARRRRAGSSRCGLRIRCRRRGESDAPLEDVGVVARVLARRIGRRQVEQPREFADEELVVGELGAAGVLPAGDEGVDRGSCGGRGGGFGRRTHAAEIAFGMERESSRRRRARRPRDQCRSDGSAGLQLGPFGIGEDPRAGVEGLAFRALRARRCRRGRRSRR